MEKKMSTLQENMEKKLDGLEQRLEQRLEEILNQLLNGGTTIVAIIITFTTMVTIIMFLLWEAIEPRKFRMV
jgi:predicted PurR-regulated permease PerM